MSNPKNRPYPSKKKEDHYFENGFLVFTEHYHIKRGYCCGNKCRHCPYNWEKVPASLKDKA